MKFYDADSAASSQALRLKEKEEDRKEMSELIIGAAALFACLIIFAVFFMAVTP